MITGKILGETPIMEILKDIYVGVYPRQEPLLPQQAGEEVLCTVESPDIRALSSSLQVMKQELLERVAISGAFEAREAPSENRKVSGRRLDRVVVVGEILKRLVALAMKQEIPKCRMADSHPRICSDWILTIGDARVPGPFSDKPDHRVNRLAGEIKEAVLGRTVPRVKPAGSGLHGAPIGKIRDVRVQSLWSISKELTQEANHPPYGDDADGESRNIWLRSQTIGALEGKINECLYLGEVAEVVMSIVSVAVNDLLESEGKPIPECVVIGSEWDVWGVRHGTNASEDDLIRSF